MPNVQARMTELDRFKKNHTTTEFVEVEVTRPKRLSGPANWSRHLDPYKRSPVVRNLNQRRAICCALALDSPAGCTKRDFGKSNFGLAPLVHPNPSTRPS